IWAMRIADDCRKPYPADLVFRENLLAASGAANSRSDTACGGKVRGRPSTGLVAGWLSLNEQRRNPSPISAIRLASRYGTAGPRVVAYAGFGCAFSHSALVTLLDSWINTNVPFLLPTTMSGFLSPVKSRATTCVPTPESLSIKWGTNSTVLSLPRTSLNQ